MTFVAGVLELVEYGETRSAERAVNDAAASAGRIRGTLTIGVIPTVTAVDLPAAIGDFHEAHPEVRITLRTGGSDEFITAIAEGRMDVAVLGLPESASVKGVRTRTLARQNLVAVVSADHPLAHRRRLRLENLTEETFVDFPAGTPGRAPSDRAFQARGLFREVAFEATSTGLILDLVRHDLAVALLAPDVVPADDRLRTIEVANGPVRIEYLAWSDFNPSPAAQAFLDQIRPPATPA
ncbi:LysR substrate-binding domain-containing protein [Cellulomonas telluris]|uniref:LysR substrate-binding domain-containing protein n=1 Tax=Cellulomonas telluris TaxID=2306636 RepID=UPI0010A87989|nr:LysR substrate-binding domain-containing protein [Cellulomonas telluris]